MLIESTKCLSNDNRNPNSFTSVSMNPTVNKEKFHLQVSVCLYSVFELGWDLGDTPCPFGWKQVLSLAATYLLVEGRPGSRCEVVLKLTVQVLVYCHQVYPLSTMEVWLSLVCVYLWDQALKPLHPQAERYCWLRE